MARVAIIGNSHASSWRQAFNQSDAVANGHELRWFTGTSRAIVARGLRVENGVVHNGTKADKGHFAVDVTSFDCVVLCGLDLRMHVYEPHFSDSVVAAAVEDSVTQSLSYRISGILREMSDLPIYVAHNPLLARPGPEAEGDMSPYLRRISRVGDAFYAKDGIVLLAQPARTVVNGWQTALKLSTAEKFYAKVGEGTANLSRGGLDRPDFDHTNAEFGAIALEDVTRRIGADLGLPGVRSSGERQAS